MEPGFDELVEVYHAEQAVLRAAKKWWKTEGSGDISGAVDTWFVFRNATGRMIEAHKAYKKAKRKAAK